MKGSTPPHFPGFKKYYQEYFLPLLSRLEFERQSIYRRRPYALLLGVLFLLLAIFLDYHLVYSLKLWFLSWGRHGQEGQFFIFFIFLCLPILIFLAPYYSPSFQNELFKVFYAFFDGFTWKESGSSNIENHLRDWLLPPHFRSKTYHFVTGSHEGVGISFHQTKLFLGRKGIFPIFNGRVISLRLPFFFPGTLISNKEKVYSPFDKNDFSSLSTSIPNFPLGIECIFLPKTICFSNDLPVKPKLVDSLISNHPQLKDVNASPQLDEIKSFAKKLWSEVSELIKINTSDKKENGSFSMLLSGDQLIILVSQKKSFFEQSIARPIQVKSNDLDYLIKEMKILSDIAHFVRISAIKWGE